MYCGTCVYVNIVALKLAMNTTIYYVFPNLAMNEQNILEKKHQLYKLKKTMKKVNLRKLCLLKFIISNFYVIIIEIIIEYYI